MVFLAAAGQSAGVWVVEEVEEEVEMGAAGPVEETERRAARPEVQTAAESVWVGAEGPGEKV